jgi:hypothetical protein
VEEDSDRVKRLAWELKTGELAGREAAATRGDKAQARAASGSEARAKSARETRGANRASANTVRWGIETSWRCRGREHGFSRSCALSFPRAFIH